MAVITRHSQPGSCGCLKQVLLDTRTSCSTSPTSLVPGPLSAVAAQQHTFAAWVDDAAVDALGALLNLQANKSQRLLPDCQQLQVLLSALPAPG